MKVLLVDDHPLILAALHTVIRGLGDDVTVVSAASAAEARRALRDDAGFDLVLLDLSLGDADGFDVLAEMRQTYPALPVVVVSASDRGADVIRAIDLGAMGFVPKRASNEMLFDALRMVMSGGIYVPPITLGGEAPPPRGGDTVPDVMRVTPQVDIPVGEAAVAAGYQGVAPLDRIGLTPRQTEVLAKLLQGKPNKLIARELNLSVETVKDHVAAVLRALNVSTRTQAVIAVGQMTRDHGPGWMRSRG
ncbi:response regulator transcription factor [Azohydromonas sp.]|uniref:response regulator transcription factor n=1 Tax=Azohydromonas sp. TaxID=1872666 RepID=UPI002B9C1644|nr:response regulator transcription factor [Azohydromonas sp.]HMM84253.1 response regulator transcription factor [Azohydromonas sp.]